MNFKIISTVISREYTTKVKKKSFLITTLIVPVIIAVGIFIMIQLVSNMTPRAQQVAVIDHTGGIVMPYLENNSSNTYTDCSSQTEEDMKGSLDKSGMDVLLVISELDSLNNVSVQAYSRKPLTVEFSGIVKRQVNKAIESYKISTYKDIENLESIIRDVKSDASLTEFLLDESGNESLSESGVYQGVSMSPTICAASWSIAAMFSATMSSLAGNFNAAASVLVNEIYGRFVKQDTPRKRMVAARAATVFVGLAVIALTFVMQYAQGADDLFNLTNKVFGVFLPPVSIPMLVGVFSKRLSKRAGLCGLVGGMVFGLAMFVVGAWWPVLREMKPCYLATAAATIFCLVLGSFLFKDTPEERKEVEDFVGKLTANP